MDVIRESAKDQHDVGLRILKRLLEHDGQGHRQNQNLVFSPLSIYMMLTLLAAGASNGQTLDDLLSFLRFKSIDELNSFLSKLFAFLFGDSSPAGGPCVTTANAVWVADYLPVKPSFQKLLETLYKGKLNQVDFVNKMKWWRMQNVWVNKETRGLIPKIFADGSVDESTKMILANTLYFKAAWALQFSDALTNNHDFHLLNGSSLKVPFITTFDDNHVVSVFDGFKVTSLSYDMGDYFADRRRFSMLIFLPNDRDGLPSLIQRACSESEFLDCRCSRGYVVAEELKIPKFKFQFGFNLVQILQDLGLESLFSVGSGFGEMVEDPMGRELYVSNMIHKAVISLNEEGTEAAALTECDVMGGSCMEVDRVKIKFVADHPFFFVIKENESGSILFIGQVLDPSLA